MSKRRRMFDIEMPEQGSQDLSTEHSDSPAGRRGPMAAAINETAESMRERRDVETQIRAENDALAHEHVRLRKLGLIIELIPLGSVDTRKLTRDRSAGPDGELAELKDSILAIGLSNPIRAERSTEGRCELIQGFRRLAAYKALLSETGDNERFGTIPAVVTEPGDTLESLYRRMVDENLVRKDISFAEMARLALEYAADPDTQERDPDKAVALLYKSAGYQKRSYIRTFVRLVERLGSDLAHARDIPRALGIALVGQLERDPGILGSLREELAVIPGRTAQEELALLRRHAMADEMAAEQALAQDEGHVSKPASGRAKTSFQFDRPEGRAKCTAAAGRLEVRLERDFTTIDRRKLERAVRQMLDDL